MKVKDGVISRKQAVKALIGWDEEAKDEDIIFTLNELPNVPTIPLSVIEKIKTGIHKEITSDGKWSGGWYEVTEEYAIKTFDAIIDKAVKECTHE